MSAVTLSGIKVMMVQVQVWMRIILMESVQIGCAITRPILVGPTIGTLPIMTRGAAGQDGEDLVMRVIMWL